MRPALLVATVLLLASACSESPLDATFPTRADAATEAAAITELRAHPQTDLSDEQLLVTMYASCNATREQDPRSAIDRQLADLAVLYPSLKDRGDPNDPYEDMGIGLRVELAYAAMGLESDKASEFAYAALKASRHLCPEKVSAQLEEFGR